MKKTYNMRRTGETVTEGQDLTQVALDRPLSDAQRDAVRGEMHRIVAHPTFSTSNRCITLLRFVVKHAKSGKEIALKERTLGMEVFGREPDYDISADPIVRRIASEVRKRLAQYYQEEPEGHSVKIHLPRGSYLPEFEFLVDVGQESSAAQNPKGASSALAIRQQEHSTFTLRSLCSDKRALALAALILLITAGALLWRTNAFLSPIERIWKPLLDTNGVILVCLPDNAQSHGKQLQLMMNGPQPKTEGPEHDMPAPAPAPASAIFQDLSAGNSVITLMTRLHKRTELAPSSTIKYSDFQHYPVILIGGENNPWVQALLSKLRYSIQFDSATREWWVQDALAPSDPKWRTGGRLGADAPTAVDYAVLTRFFNEETGQWIVALSGLTFNSTMAAGELVTRPELAKKIPSSVRAHGNFQIVLRSTLVGKESGPIQVVAVHTW